MDAPQPWPLARLAERTPPGSSCSGAVLLKQPRYPRSLLPYLVAHSLEYLDGRTNCFYGAYIALFPTPNPGACSLPALLLLNESDADAADVRGTHRGEGGCEVPCWGRRASGSKSTHGAARGARLDTRGRAAPPPTSRVVSTHKLLMSRVEESTNYRQPPLSVVVQRGPFHSVCLCSLALAMNR